MKLGIDITKCTTSEVKVSRRTLESQIAVGLEQSKSRACQIQTGIKFFDHMLLGLASRACINLDASYLPATVATLDHVICEDVGLTLGQAVRAWIEAKRLDGVAERGYYCVAFDEALVRVTLAFDGRAYTFLRGNVAGSKQAQVEDMLSTNLRQFFEGFAQGSGCVVSVEFIFGNDSHHTWEAAFKAFGEALRESLSPCPFRAGGTIGLKGTGKER